MEYAFGHCVGARVTPASTTEAECCHIVAKLWRGFCGCICAYQDIGKLVAKNTNKALLLSTHYTCTASMCLLSHPLLSHTTHKLQLCTQHTKLDVFFTCVNIHTNVYWDGIFFRSHADFSDNPLLQPQSRCQLEAVEPFHLHGELQEYMCVLYCQSFPPPSQGFLFFFCFFFHLHHEWYMHHVVIGLRVYLLSILAQTVSQCAAAAANAECSTLLSIFW